MNRIQLGTLAVLAAVPAAAPAVARSDEQLWANAALTVKLDDRWRLTLGSAPGYYERNRGRDLGSTIEFHSTAELSYDLGRQRRIALSLGHTSNGGLRGDHNPGTETLLLSWSIPLGRK